MAVYDPDPATGAYVDITPDGRTVLMAGGQSAKLWDVDDTAPYGDPYQSSPAGIGMTRFLGKGRELAVLVGPDLYAWWIDRRRLGFHSEDIHSLLVDRAQKRLITGASDGRVRIWSLRPRNRFVKAIPFVPGDLSPDVLALSADGRFVAVGASDRKFDFLAKRASSTRAEVRTFDVETGLPVGPPHAGHEGVVNRLALTRDGTRLASASADGTVRLWRSDSSTAVAIVKGTGDQRPADIAFDERGALAVAFDGAPLRLLDDAGVVVQTAHAASVSALGVLPDREFLLAMRDGELRRWKPDGGIETRVCAAADRADTIHSLSVTAAGTAALISHGRGVERVDLRDCSRTVVALPTARDRRVAATRRLAISETAGGTLTAWDLEANRPLGIFQPGSDQYLTMTPHAAAAASAADRVAAIVDDVPVVFDLAREALVARACEVAALLDAHPSIDHDRERICSR